MATICLKTGERLIIEVDETIRTVRKSKPRVSEIEIKWTRGQRVRCAKTGEKGKILAFLDRVTCLVDFPGGKRNVLFTDLDPLP